MSQMTAASGLRTVPSDGVRLGAARNVFAVMCMAAAVASSVTPWGALFAVGCFAASTWRLRMLLAVTAGGVFVIPWPGSALLGVCGYLALSARGERFSWLGQVLRSGRWVLWAALPIGAIAGVVAVSVTYSKWAAGPFLLDYSRPPLIAVVAGIVGVAAFNALGEELLWRAALSRELASLPRALFYGVEAVSFGLAHLHGIPAGILGCVLAGVFALVLTFLQRRAGLRAALAAHWAADVVIFTGLYVVGVIWA